MGPVNGDFCIFPDFQRLFWMHFIVISAWSTIFFNLKTHTDNAGWNKFRKYKNLKCLGAQTADLSWIMKFFEPIDNCKGFA